MLGLPDLLVEPLLPNHDLDLPPFPCNDQAEGGSIRISVTIAICFLTLPFLTFLLLFCCSRTCVLISQKRRGNETGGTNSHMGRTVKSVEDIQLIALSVSLIGSSASQLITGDKAISIMTDRCCLWEIEIIILSQQFPSIVLLAL